MNAFERASKNMLTVDFDSKYYSCWLCGRVKKTTKHHAIPIALKPKFNKVVPICNDCHVKINNLYGDNFGSHQGKIKKLENLVEYYKNLYTNYREKFEDLKLKYWTLDQLYENHNIIKIEREIL